MSRETFCALPWVHSFVNIGGEYQVCCTSEEFNNDIIGADGRPLNISDQVSLERVMNAPTMRELRVLMLEGKWHSMCGRCKITEEMGGVSRRMIENDRYEDVREQLIQETAPDGTIPAKVLSADYRLANLCNLQCRMCGPRASTRWLKDWNLFKSENEHLGVELLDEYSNYTWINRPELVREFESKASELRHLHFAGGEPLLIPQMRQLLEKCIELGVANQIELTYNTNLTKLPEAVISLWPHFKEVRLLCSVDGFGDLNDYIREGSHWPVIDKNLRFIDSRSHELHITDILLSTTVQAYNVLYLDRLIEYLESFNNIVKFPNLINLLGPNYLRTQILPSELKHRAAERLAQARRRAAPSIPPNKSFLLENVDQVVNFMFAEDHTNLRDGFASFTRKFDAAKKTSLASVCPELVFNQEDRNEAGKSLF